MILYLCPGSTCGAPVRPPCSGHISEVAWGKGQACSPRPPITPSPSPPASAQALSLKESEKTALSEKLVGTRHSLAAISLEMERQKRDAQSRQEQDRVGQVVGWGVGALHVSFGGTQACLRGSLPLPWAASRLWVERHSSLGVPIRGRWPSSILVSPAV